jgi:hypothetical protein
MIELVLAVYAAICALATIALFALALVSKVRQDLDEPQFKSDLDATDDAGLRSWRERDDRNLVKPAVPCRTSIEELAGIVDESVCDEHFVGGTQSHRGFEV